MGHQAPGPDPIVLFYPSLVQNQPLPLTGALTTDLLLVALALKLTTDADDQPADFRRVTLLVLVASALYLIPQVFGVEAGDQAYLSAINYFAAYGATDDIPLPEIDFQNPMNTWINLRVSGDGGQPYVIYFQGVLTACNVDSDPLPTGTCQVDDNGKIYTWWSPTLAWTNFWNALNSNGVGQNSLNYGTNIRSQ
jgi:hypothetical protein